MNGGSGSYHSPPLEPLEGTKRKSSENLKIYAKRWRKLADKVKPSMKEEEIVRTFIKTHDPSYFEKIFRMIGFSFAEIINKLEEYDVVRIENNLRGDELGKLKTNQIIRLFLLEYEIYHLF